MTQHQWHLERSHRNHNYVPARHFNEWLCDRCGKSVKLDPKECPDDADLFKDEDCDLALMKQVMET